MYKVTDQHDKGGSAHSIPGGEGLKFGIVG